LTFEANAKDHMQYLLSFSLGSHLLLTTICLAWWCDVEDNY